ncbi:hypothetical protein [Neptuniibacter sp. QD37_11]|uniref:hypothetical protein n=1 Tax=Neptuniibacter sp. QD37_11 TaxID=3398209 RepID=UPI0039F4B97F
MNIQKAPICQIVSRETGELLAEYQTSEVDEASARHRATQLFSKDEQFSAAYRSHGNWFINIA